MKYDGETLSNNDCFMAGNIRDRTLALAGLFQAAALVQQLARTGKSDENALSASVGSIFKIDARSTEEVYGSAEVDLRLGLETLKQQFQNERKRLEDMEITRYSISLLVLERKLAANAQILKTIRDGIERAARQAEHFSSVLHENVIANLGDLYANTISKIGPRIMINGDAVYLQNADNAARIRALLLAGIRAAVLWQQKGGRRWQLLLSRNKFVQTADQILAGTAN